MGNLYLHIFSGGFDPITAGHIELIKKIRDRGENHEILILLNNDEWLTKKKGYVFMPFEQRKYILENIKGVHHVLEAKCDAAGTVIPSLQNFLTPEHLAITPYAEMYFVNGGDRNNTTTPEDKFLQGKKIRPSYPLGGEYMYATFGDDALWADQDGWILDTVSGKYIKKNPYMGRYKNVHSSDLVKTAMRAIETQLKPTI